MTVVASAKAALLGENGVLAPLLSGVKVSYSPPRDLLREAVWGGRVAGPVALKGFAGSVRVKRSEELSLQLHVRVWTPGQKTAETVEARAAAIGDVIALYLAANWTIGDLANLKSATVSALDLDSWTDDDGAGAVLTMTVDLMSYLS